MRKQDQNNSQFLLKVVSEIESSCSGYDPEKLPSQLEKTKFNNKMCWMEFTVRTTLKFCLWYEQKENFIFDICKRKGSASAVLFGGFEGIVWSCVGKQPKWGDWDDSMILQHDNTFDYRAFSVQHFCSKNNMTVSPVYIIHSS